jgi:uncharacterized protein with PQ loop repeat
VWLAGDVFNILGAVLQGVLPTMIILAIYYTLADIVLLGQCFYYRGFTWKDEVIPPKKHQSGTHIGEANERTGLLAAPESRQRQRRWSEVSASHLSPVVPLLDPPRSSNVPAVQIAKPTTTLQALLWNTFSVLTVCAAGVFGWYLSNRSQGKHRHQSTSTSDDVLNFSLWGQIFGYFCAALYLGSRIPQLLLNYRRKSTEGVSMLFFLFACIGNLTYVLSIFAYEPHCHNQNGDCENGEAATIYGRYILVNASWLAGSLGTFILDFGIFAQFFIYRVEDENILRSTESRAVTPGDQRPLLERGDSEFV